MRLTCLIVRKESIVLWRSGVFCWASGCLFVLLTIALLVALDGYRRRVAAIDGATAAQRDQWLHKQMANPHLAAHAGTVLFRPLHPLAVLDVGIDPFVGTSIFLEAHRRTPFAHAIEERAPEVGRFATLTAALTLQALVPLLIVLLTYGSFAVEREDGTLRHLASLGVSTRAMLWGKAIGVTAPMLGVGVPILAGGLLVSHLATPFDLSRGALLVAAYLTYFLVWIGAGLGVSLRARSSQTALTVLLGLWIAGCLLVPRLAWTAVQRYVGVPTARQFVEALEAESGEGTGFLEQRRAIEKRLLAEYSVASANDLPLSTWGMTLFEREVDSTKRYNEQFSRLFERYEQQQRLINLVSLLCPPLALRTVSMSLAGTDASHYRDFAEAAERYRYALVQRMNRIAMESRLYNSRPTLAGGPDRPIFPEGEAQAYASVGEFLYDMPDARSAFSRVRLPAFALAAWLAGMGACLSRLFVRFDIG